MGPIDSLLVGATRGAQPAASAAVALVGVNGEIADLVAKGVVGRWADDEGRQAQPEQSAVAPNTIFDLASITKLFTAAALLIVLDEHGLGEGTPVADVLAEFRSPALAESTFADLLRHTGGWPAEWPDRRRDSQSMRRFREGTPTDPPGTTYRYSCVGYIWAGLAAEALAGEGLDAVISRTLITPLGMTDTTFLPDASLRTRIAATEYQRDPQRGLVHGHVHDEASWVLGGVTGNAGLFGSAPDLFRFAELLRCGGTFRGTRLLPEWAAEVMTVSQLPNVVTDRPLYKQALGPRIDDRDWMGDFAGRGAVGHTGFTGTSVLTVPGQSHSVILLTNRVHPSRDWTDVRELRSRVASEAAKL